MDDVKKCEVCGADFQAFDELVISGKTFLVCPNCGIIRLKK